MGARAVTYTGAAMGSAGMGRMCKFCIAGRERGVVECGCVESPVCRSSLTSRLGEWRDCNAGGVMSLSQHMLL